jgi:methylamine---glutamate N-methyltransferase subunit B
VVTNPDGAHNIAVGLDVRCDVDIVGHAGYYAAA